ncbi:hypothetical protein [uncultured Treponema sp.]|uniref:hypothetical protein n=1 Tax=uncultured Treponema sp. TaxID=162155 RepID=UPI00280B0613|nr:hypothetical protein [uncultured Treponema sp.]
MFLTNDFSLQMLEEFPASVKVSEVSELPEGLESAVGHADGSWSAVQPHEREA